MKRKVVSACSFGIVVIAFFFSFLNMDYHNTTLGQISGLQLATGIRETGSPVSEMAEAIDKPLPVSAYKNESNNYFAMAALLLASCGLVLSLLFLMKQEMLLGITGFSGLLALLLLRLQIDSLVARQSASSHDYLLHIEYAPGYWMAVLFFLIAGLSNLSAYVDQISSPVSVRTYTPR